tara:strand:+ start:258 stop:620 length:363 start_codon:yes stop_codon:yes gene_type:complete
MSSIIEMHPIYSKMYYKPLPDYLEVGESPIEGFGLFALEDIDPDTDIGMSHIKVPIIQGFVRTPIGGFLNHAEDSNCELSLEFDWDDYRTYHVFTTEKIRKGEELTLNYYVDDHNYGQGD